MDGWQTLAAALAAAAAAVVAALSVGLRGVIVAWFRRAEKRIGRDARRRWIRLVGPFNDAVNQLDAMPFVGRVLLFETTGWENGEGKKCYVSSFHGWSHRPGATPQVTYRHRVQIDPAYRAMLAEVDAKGYSIQETARMPEGAMLKGYYTAEGVVYAVIFLVCHDDDELIYMTVASYTAAFTAVEFTQVSLVVDAIRSSATDD